MADESDVEVTAEEVLVNPNPDDLAPRLNNVGAWVDGNNNAAEPPPNADELYAEWEVAQAEANAQFEAGKAAAAAAEQNQAIEDAPKSLDDIS